MSKTSRPANNDCLLEQQDSTLNEKEEEQIQDKGGTNQESKSTNKVIIVKNVEEIRTQPSAEEAEQKITNALSAWRKTKVDSSKMKQVKRKSATISISPSFKHKRKSLPKSLKGNQIITDNDDDNSFKKEEPEPEAFEQKLESQCSSSDESNHFVIENKESHHDQNSLSLKENITDENITLKDDQEQDSNSQIKSKKQIAKRISQKFNRKSFLEKKKPDKKFLLVRQDSEVRFFAIIIYITRNAFYSKTNSMNSMSKLFLRYFSFHAVIFFIWNL